MARKMTDDEVENYTYNKLFGELDGIRSGSMFKKEADGLGAPQEDAADNIKPGVPGIKLTIQPLMAGASESGRPPEGESDEDDEDEDKLKGIGGMSPLMSQLHGNR